MRRKLIKQGAGGYTVSLPIKWVRAHNLEPGQEIDVIEEENALKIVSTTSLPSTKTTTLSVQKASFNVYRSLIGGLYRAGYDEIKVNFKDSSILSDLQKTVDLLPGYELLHVGRDSCVVKNTTLNQTVDLHAHFLKIVHSINTMFEIIQQDLISRTFNSEQQLFLLRGNVLKNRDLIIRTIAQQRLTDEHHLPYYTLVNYSWMMARSCYYLYGHLKKSKPSFVSLLKETHLYFRAVFATPTSVDNYKVREGYDCVFSKLNQQLSLKVSSLPVAYLLPLLMAIESCNSTLLLLGENSH
ncbi:hypothetical protein HYV86_02805 [Candidatus Woesearchaeota archaeon]|nr:hypothetical protein [Candidatus Woesearchaeota archaeon]